MSKLHKYIARLYIVVSLFVGITLWVGSVLVRCHEERNHSGIGNVLLFPSGHGNSGDGLQCTDITMEVGRRDRLGGLLKHYHREAA